jgi:hypothetical protein
MTTEDHITAVKAQYPEASEQKLGKLIRISMYSDHNTDDAALSFYYGMREDAWANAYENTH